MSGPSKKFIGMYVHLVFILHMNQLSSSAGAYNIQLIRKFMSDARETV